MNITKIIVNESAAILSAIGNLTEDNCVEAFDKYFYNGAEKASDFEASYVRLLEQNIGDLGKAVMEKVYSNLTREELLKRLVWSAIDSEYSLSSMVNNGDLDYFFNNLPTLTRVEILRFISSYMVDTLINLKKIRAEQEASTCQ